MVCNMFLTVLAIIASSSLANAQCLFSDTECSCSAVPGGNPCLRYLSGSGSSTMCETYACGSGNVCDCDGSEVCDVSDCSASRVVYRSTGSAPLAIGTNVACELASQVTCVTPRSSAALPSSPMATPSAASSPSSSSSPPPSSAPSSAPSSSPSSLPSSSPSAAAVPSPSPQPVAIGGACDATTVCENGAGCSCLNKCARIVTIEVIGMGDDSFKPVMCGTQFGNGTKAFDEIGTWTYTGPCSSLYVEQLNSPTQAGWSAITGTVQEVGGPWFPMRTDSSGIQGIGMEDPPPGYMSDPLYDFSAWTPLIIHTGLSARTPYINFMNQYNSETLTMNNDWDNTGPFPPNWYKFDLPFC